MSNFAVSIPSYIHVSHGDEDTIKEYPDKKFRNSIKYQNSYI